MYVQMVRVIVNFLNLVYDIFQKRLSFVMIEVMILLDVDMLHLLYDDVMMMMMMLIGLYCQRRLNELLLVYFDNR